MTSRTVIVTDGEQRAALAVVRSLGAAGYRCVVAASSRASIAGVSRFCARSVTVPDALARPEEFAEAIATLAADERASLVLPIAEQSMLAILPIRSRLLPAVVPFPDLPAFRALSDKQKVLEEASKLGIAVPAQVVVADQRGIAELDFQSLRYPIVIKPARSVGGPAGERIKLGVSYATDSGELRRRILSLPSAAFPLLLQQRVVGPGTGIFLLRWNGEAQAVFAHQRLCEKPPTGGVSVYCESIAADAALVDASRKLLDSFGWRGVAMVEFKRDAESGQPFLMEVNGRFWGSLQLAIDAGVDFPRLLAAYALGDPVAPQPPYRVGVRSRWWWGQVDHVVGRVRRGRRIAPLPPGTLSVSRALGDLLFGPFRRADYEEVLWWNDPRPFFNETVRWIGVK
jgi:predicted ATP-grasp superfamily ATP-dependent carboligase